MQKDREENPYKYYRNGSNLKATTKERRLCRNTKHYQINETMAKQILHRWKFKKFNTMKHKLKPTVKTTNFTEGNKWPEKSPTTERGTYAEIVKATKNPSVTASKTNLSNYKTNKNTQKILSSLSPANGTRKQENIPSSNNSNTNMVKHEKYQQEINELKWEIKLLKQPKKKQYDAKTEMDKNNIKLESKNENMASVSHGSQQENVQLITVINLMEQTMKTLSNCWE